MFRSIARKFLGHSTFFLFNLSTQLREFVTIKVLRRHQKIEISKATQNHSTKFLILALYYKGSGLESIKRLISLFLEEDFQVICVINKSKSSATLINGLQDFPITILTRPNIGRDMGAYQAGYKYVSTNYEKIDYLFFANDSCYYFSDTKLKLIKNNDFLKHAWVSLYSNYEYHFHAQSFMMGFNEDILNLKGFANFWQKYNPKSSRRHSIDMGEVKLSQVLLTNGFKNFAYINPVSLDVAMQIDAPNRNELKVIYHQNFIFKMNHLQNTLLDRRFLRSVSAPNLIDIRHDMHELLLLKNPTHWLGLYLTRVMKMPLKLDIVKSGFCTMAEILDLANSLDLAEHEKIDISQIFLDHKSAATYKGLEKIWYSLGLI